MGDIVPNQLFVTGYNHRKITDERGIKDIFQKYGNIKEIAFKGAFSFVKFAEETEAQEAQKALNGEEFDGQRLKVDIVDNRKGKRSGPQESDLCYKCNKSGHWARDCPNRSPRRSRHRYSGRQDRYHRHRRHSKRSESRSRSYSSDSSRRKRHSKKYSSRRQENRRKSPRRSPSASHSSVSRKQRQSASSSK